MPPDRPLTPTSLPHLEVMLTDDGSRTLRNKLLDETFHSGCGALAECWYVYLLNSGIQDKLAARPAQPVRVLEMGFGTGMGWLLTATAAQVHQAALNYVSVESDLLPADILKQIDTASAIKRGIADGWLPPAFSAIESIESDWLGHRGACTVNPIRESSTVIDYAVSPINHLQLVLAELCEWLSQAPPPSQLFDAIYFDAFSPATNPQLWQAEIFSQLWQWLSPDGRLVSYCVNGAVRRALQSAGYRVERHPGPPGGKREVLIGFPDHNGSFH